MFKNLMILIVCFVFSQTLFAKVQQENEDSLNHDLNFRLDQDSESERQVASDEEDEKQDSEDSERDIASENEDLSAPIRYWKY